MNKGLLTTLILFLFTTNNFAQNGYTSNWDYEAFPNLPFNLDHIQLDLNVEPETALIEGAGRYVITSRRSDLTEIVFNTSDIEIQETSMNGEILEFRVSSDSLIIQLPDTLKLSDKAEILITWQSASPYGIHKDVMGNMWTSLNPKARLHWIPIPDHPEVATTLEASITLPAEMEAVFNGKLSGDEVISAEERTVRWVSQTPIPVSGISLAVGNFEVESARSGVKEISLFTPENILMEEVRSKLLSTGVSTLKNYERIFSYEFPYDALNIVVLEDHQWEEVQSGAGIIYLYQSLGSLPTQLKRGIAEQWLGNYQRYLDVPSPKYEFLKAALTSASQTDQLKNPDSLRSIQYWNTWEAGLDKLNNDLLKNTIQDSWTGLIQEFEGVTTWEDYAGFWYDKTGAYWNELPKISKSKVEMEESFKYAVSYQYDELNSSLLLVFEAQGNSAETLVGVEVREYGFMDTTKSEISFTGQVDSVSVALSEDIEYVILDQKSDLKLEFIEDKPFMFLIRQLNSSNTDHRLQAAKQLRQFSDNPDLQLALQDVMRDEQNPKIRAELLETLAKTTSGASGTEQNFLDMLNSDDLDIQLAGIRALVNYPDNDNVGYAVQTKLLQTSRDTVFKTALNTYREISSPEDQLSLVNRLEREDKSGRKTLQVLRVAATSDTTGQALIIADRFALGNFPYSLRKQAIELLLKYESNQDYWYQTLEMLQEDRDPRIRFYSLKAVKFLTREQAQILLENRANEEFDPRVLARIRNLFRS
ncbi:MAG: hypothetical protein WD022_08780 [Balneolaceae bacterium]